MTNNNIDHASASTVGKGCKDSCVGSNMYKDTKTFDDFIVGENNRCAYEACVTVAEHPGRNEYNPLYLYGKTGLGKTHLIQSIAHHIKKHYPKMTVVSITAEMFANQLIDAITKNTTDEFKSKFKKIDLLMIDDIQDIVGRQRTQYELLRLTDYLYNNQIQMIFTSDRLPKEFYLLDDSLKSRFMWGIPVGISFPDYDTRLSIIRKKAAIKGLGNLQDDIVYYLAESFPYDIRLIEGMLNKILFYRDVEKNTLTIEQVRSLLKDFVVERPRITLEMIVLVVSEYYEVSIEDIRSKKRKGNIDQARCVIIYLGHLLTNESILAICFSVGRRDEQIIRRTVSMIDEKRNDDVELNKQLEEIIRIIKDR